MALLVPASLALATLPRWSPELHWVVGHLPVFGWFRCPARYTLLTSLGLALLAGHGMDRSISRGRFAFGVILALAFGSAALAWGISLARDPRFRADFGASTYPIRFGAAARRGRSASGRSSPGDRAGSGAWLPVLIAAVELGVLYHLGPVALGLPARPCRSRADPRAAGAGAGLGLVAGRRAGTWRPGRGSRRAIPTWGSPRRRRPTCWKVLDPPRTAPTRSSRSGAGGSA